MVSRGIDVGIETAYGTVQATRTGVRVTQFSDPVNRSVVVEEALDQVSAAAIYGGVYKVSGTLEGVFRAKGMGPLMQAFTGASAATGAMTLGETPKSLSMGVGDDQGNMLSVYTGVGLTQMELTCNVKEFIRAKFSYIGQKATVTHSTGSIAAIPANDLPSVFYNAELTLDSVAVPAKNCTITFQRKMDEDYYYIGDPFLKGMYLNGLSDVSGSLTFGSGEWERIMAVSTGGTGNATLPGDSNPLGGGALTLIGNTPDGTTPILTIDLADIRFTDFNRSVQGRNMFEKSVNFKCQVAAPEDVTITLPV